MLSIWICDFKSFAALRKMLINKVMHYPILSEETVTKVSATVLLLLINSFIYKFSVRLVTAHVLLKCL